VTGLAGLAAVDELALRLGMVASFDAGIGVIKQRDRGLSAGQLLVGMASGQLVGQDHLAGLDRVREDAGSALLEQAPVAPSTTAGGWPVPSAPIGWPGSRPGWPPSTPAGWRWSQPRSGRRWCCATRRLLSATLADDV